MIRSLTLLHIINILCGGHTGKRFHAKIIRDWPFIFLYLYASFSIYLFLRNEIFHFCLQIMFFFAVILKSKINVPRYLIYAMSNKNLQNRQQRKIFFIFINKLKSKSRKKNYIYAPKTYKDQRTFSTQLIF